MILSCYKFGLIFANSYLCINDIHFVPTILSFNHTLIFGKEMIDENVPGAKELSSLKEEVGKVKDLGKNLGK